MKLNEFIVPTTLENTDNRQRSGDESFRTTDLVYLDDCASVEKVDKSNRICCPTDYVVMNGALISTVPEGVKGRKSCWTWLRSGCSDGSVVQVYLGGALVDDFVDRTNGSLRPALQLNLSSVISARSASDDAFKIGEYEVCGETKYHTIEFGEYPKTYVGSKLNEDLERAMSAGKVKPTGKKFIGRNDDRVDLVYNNEYIFEGQKYVRVSDSYFYDLDSELSDGTPAPDDGTPLWVKVEPVTWIIRNWDDMPFEINPMGTGNAEVIDIQTEEAIIPCMPFYPQLGDDNCCMWQNSTIRGYLNGINVNNITTNGNLKYTAPNGGDFSEQNFLSEALSNEIVMTAAKNTKGSGKMPKGTYGVTVVDSKEKPMPVAEQIEFYINNSIPFMLHGPSGVGKSRRIKDICPDYSSIKLARGMVPENAQGRDVFGFVNGKAESDWAPPAWYKDMCEKAEAKAPEKHILFIDEVTNVDLEQSYLYDIVLERQIAPGIGKFPDNVSVVLAGNEIKDSSVASALAEPLFRRQAHIYLEPNIPDWLEWGSRLNEEGNPNVHPLISDFVAAQGMKVFYTPYDNDNPPKHVLDPRGWEQVSDIIYANNGELRLELLANKVGSSIAQNILAFAKQPVITVEDVLAGDFDVNQIPRAYDAKYSMAMRLRNATEEELSPVRAFVKEFLGDEMLSVYDATWVGKDKDRAIFLNELKKQQPLDDVEEVVVPQARYGIYPKDELAADLAEHKSDLSWRDGVLEIEDFFDESSDKNVGIVCGEEWQADVLMYVFHKMGKKWSTGEDYKVGDSNWKKHKNNTYYSADGTYGDCLKNSRILDSIVNFLGQVDFSGVASDEEIIAALGKDGASFKIDVDEFWKSEADLAIRCKEEWQANILTYAFHRMGRTWQTGKPYNVDNCWSYNKADTCYTNYGLFGPQNKINGNVYSFEEVDLSKYLTEAEIATIQTKMPGTAYDNIKVM